MAKQTMTKTKTNIGIRLLIAIAVLIGVGALAFAILPALQTPKKSTETKNIPAAQPLAGSLEQEINRGFANPAAVHCQELGYSYETKEDANGQYGVCVFPDKAECEEWEFLQGFCGKERSYCAQNGYDLKIKNDGKNPFSREYAVCVDKNGKEVGSVVDLMDLYKKSEKSGGTDQSCIDYPCDKGKVFVCNKPGTPAEDTLCVAEEAAKAFLNQGGYCGFCGDDNSLSQSIQSDQTASEIPDNRVKLIHEAQAAQTESLNFQSTLIHEAQAQGTLPPAFDWRDYQGENWMTSVKNQGTCGSCWSFGSVGTVEAVANIDANDPNLDLDLSEQYRISNCAETGSCCGGDTEAGLTFIQRYGVPDEACMPYVDQEFVCCPSDYCSYSKCSDRCADWQTRMVKISQWQRWSSDQSEIKEALVNYGPLTVSLKMRGEFDENDIYRCGPVEFSSHAVVLVGYNDAGGYWIIKNSWGTGAANHDNGYFKLAYGNCNMEKYVRVVFKSKPFIPKDIYISNCQELQAIKDWPINNYYLANDIDCSDTVNWNGGAGFAPIGDYFVLFSGTFDGQGHTIKGLYINRPGDGYVGLFGKLAIPELSQIIIKNVGLENANITGNQHVGGLVGRNYADISNSYVTGQVNCESYCGGLAGTNSGEIANSYSRVSVNSSSESPTIGGFVGYNQGIISNSYSSGSVSATLPEVEKGLIGYCQGIVENSFWDRDVSGTSIDGCAAGTTGKTAAEMKNVATFTQSGTVGLITPWDFVANPYNDTANEDIWYRSDYINSGYPILNTFLPERCCVVSGANGMKNCSSSEVNFTECESHYFGLGNIQFFGNACNEITDCHANCVTIGDNKLYGDLDCDNVIGPGDVNIIKSLVANIQHADSNCCVAGCLNGDMDKDGVFGPGDIANIQDIVAGTNTTKEMYNPTVIIPEMGYQCLLVKANNVLYQKDVLYQCVDKKLTLINDNNCCVDTDNGQNYSQQGTAIVTQPTTACNHNGKIDLTTEQCDDANTLNGDGCDNDCALSEGSEFRSHYNDGPSCTQVCASYGAECKQAYKFSENLAVTFGGSQADSCLIRNRQGPINCICYNQSWSLQKTDSCLDSTKLREYSCTSQGITYSNYTGMTYTDYTCNQCVEGACR